MASPSPLTPAVAQMLQRYNCVTSGDYQNALKEIIQEIALLGLWRSKFFEQAAFYGGSALRILYGLDRFSEDLDFSLLEPNTEFRLSGYLQAVQLELASLGFEVSVSEKLKSTPTAIESAFIKAGTRLHLLKVQVPAMVSKKIPQSQVLTVKLEVDTAPPAVAQTEAKVLLQPIPFSVLSYTPPDLFAGKLHAILARSWTTRVKGRDFYDFIWYLGRNTPCRLSHLESRLRQTQSWVKMDTMTSSDAHGLLAERFAQLDIAAAKADVLPFVKDPASVALWSREFFLSLLPRLTFV